MWVGTFTCYWLASGTSSHCFGKSYHLVLMSAERSGCLGSGDLLTHLFSCTCLCTCTHRHNNYTHTHMHMWEGGWMDGHRRADRHTDTNTRMDPHREREREGEGGR